MKIVDREKEVYQLFLEKGCINTYDLSDEDKMIVSGLIEKNLLYCEEIEHSNFIVLTKDKIDDIENIEDFDFDYDDIDVQIKESIKLFRKERNAFLKFIAEEVVVCGEDILRRYDSLIFNKCKSYIKYYQAEGGIALYHLNPLGYKAIRGEFDSNIIDLAILRYLNNSIARINDSTNSLLAMIIVLRKLKTDFYLDCLDLGEYKKYEKYFTKMLQLSLVDFFYGKNYKLICLTEKAYNIINEDCNEDYITYVNKLDSKIKSSYSETYIPTKENTLIKRLIDNNLIAKSELDEASENLKVFLSEYILSMEFLNNEYIYLKGQFYAERSIPNKKSNLLNSALEFLIENNIENIPELDSASKRVVYNIFTQSRSLDKTLGASLWKSGFYIREIKDSTKHKVLLYISILIYKGILSLKVAGNKIYILITEEGCKYFNIPKYNVTEERILKRELMRNDYEGVLWGIYKQKFMSKTKAEQLYGKSICSDLKGYIEELNLNGYSYIQLTKVGCNVISKKYRPNKSAVTYTLINSKRTEKATLDIIDKTILNFIYKYNFVDYMSLVLVVGDRANRLRNSGLLDSHDRNNKVSVSKKGCLFIKKKHNVINNKYINIFSKKIKKSKGYFFKKELAAELISVLGNEETSDKDYICGRCNSVLTSHNEVFDDKYEKSFLTTQEESILYTMWFNKLCVHIESINKDMYDKFNTIGVIKRCKGGEYCKTDDVCSAMYNQFKPDRVKIYPLIESGNDSEYTILNSTLILKKEEDIKVKKKSTEQKIKGQYKKDVKKMSIKEQIKGKKQQAIKQYKKDVKYLFNGVYKSNLKKHIDFLKNGRYIIFDTEFSTMNGDETNMIEISAIKVDKLNIVDEFSYLIRDHKDMLTKGVSRLTKIKEEMLLKDGVEEAYALNKFIEFIEDLPVVAHAIENDWHACVLLGCENNNIPLPKNEILDSYLILKCMYPKSKCGLDGLISKFNLRSKDIPRHRALGDSIYTLNAIKKAVKSENEKLKIKPKAEGETKIEIVRRELIDVELNKVI